jgi:hypothetical protein
MKRLEAIFGFCACLPFFAASAGFLQTQASATPAQPAAPPARVAILAGRLLDPRKGNYADNVFIAIEGKRTTGIGASRCSGGRSIHFDRPAGAHRLPRAHDVKIFDHLRDSLKDALAFEQGCGVNLGGTQLPPRPAPSGVPQCKPTAFRRVLECQPKHNSELGAGHPPPATSDLKLLAIAKRNPQARFTA